AGSPEAIEAKNNPTLAQADFVGIGIHCSQGAALCSAGNNGKADVLPNEPGGYSGFMGLFGHKYVAPQISPGGPLTDLTGNGINQSNTLFVFTADEGDHFVGGAPSPVGCDGVNTPCTYSQIGEINANLAGLLATEQGVTTPFKVHSDSAPTIYITGNPARTDPAARSFARDLDQLTAVSPITGNTDKISQFLADAVEMKILHMVTADPARTPTLVMFADPNYFLFAGAPNCNSPCVTENPGFAWNHGDFQPEIVTTWLGMVGPGVRDDGVDGKTWSDHTDIRPTILLLAGLKDDYGHDGRVLSEALTGAALPPSVTGNGNIFQQLAQSYKQINASVGQFGLGTLRISNSALISND